LENPDIRNTSDIGVTYWYDEGYNRESYPVNISNGFALMNQDTIEGILDLTGDRLDAVFTLKIVNFTGDYYDDGYSVLQDVNLTQIVKETMLNYSIEHEFVEIGEDGKSRLRHIESPPEKSFVIPQRVQEGNFTVNYRLEFNLQQIFVPVGGLDFSVWGWIKIFLIGKLIYTVIVGLVDLRDLDLVADFDSAWKMIQIFFGNVFWMYFGGLEIGALYVVYILFCAFSIILMPLGDRILSLLPFIVSPFGRSLIRLSTVETQRESTCSQRSMWVLWILFGGIPLALFHVCLSIGFMTIIFTYYLGKKHFDIVRAIIDPVQWEADVELYPSKSIETLTFSMNVDVDDEDKDRRAKSPLLRALKSPRKSKSSLLF
jgi:uncharacterized membrane protein YccF (DUF307 family)